MAFFLEEFILLKFLGGWAEVGGGNFRFTEKLQRWYRDSHTPFTKLPLLLTSCVTVVGISILRS